MIRYTLKCEKGHVFEEWFRNMAEYDSKKESGELKCPECGNTNVSKAIMSPSISSGFVSSCSGKASDYAESCCSGSCPFGGSCG